MRKGFIAAIMAKRRRWHGDGVHAKLARMPADLAIHDWPLPYETRLQQRALASVDLVVIHCTELPDMKMTREFGERVRYAESQTGNSGHYYIDSDGTIYRFVANERIANHTFGYNPRSIGIEIANIGRYPHWGDSRHQAFTVRVHKATNRFAARAAAPIAHGRFRACTTSPVTRISTGASNRPATIQPSCCRAARIPGRCFRGTQIVPASGLERLIPQK